MCKSIAQHWRKEIYPDRWLDRLHAPVAQHLTNLEQEELLGLELMPQEVEDEPNDVEVRQWNIQLLKYHKAAGHPNNYNLARIVREAGKPRWQVQAAFRLHCDDCAALKLGGSSSGRIPPASLRPLPMAWEMVGMDTTEWTPPHSKLKYNVLVLMDLATHFKSATILKEFSLSEQQHESSQEILDALFRCWLSLLPKMKILVPDNAKSMVSQMVRSTLADLNIQVEVPPAKESWSHGMMERCAQEVKISASKLTLSFPSCSATSILAMAVNALNSTEIVQGYTPHQWVFGKQFSFTLEDERSMAQIMPEAEGPDFVQLLANRSQAEEIARKSRAAVVLNKLHNSKVRQPLQTFAPTELVKIWRKYSLEGGGKRGGLKKMARPQWLGPGRVVLHEVIHGQQPGDPRRHIVWVIIGGQLHRCSVHSVRRVTERERLDYELHCPEDPSQWRSIDDLMPRRSYIDVTHEEPGEEEEEFPHLPALPDSTTMAGIPPRPPHRRHFMKRAISPSPEREVVPEVPDVPPPVNDYTPSYSPEVEEPDEEIGNTGVGSGIPTLRERSGDGASQPLLSVSSGSSSVPEPESKKARQEEDNLFHALEIVDEAVILTVEFEFHSQREKEKFLRKPSLFLAQKMRDGEVRLEKLSPAHRKLFVRAKTKEVNSFLSNAAVRRCLDSQEVTEALTSQRLMRCRWVLTWKPTPEESLAEALQEVQEKPLTTTFTSDGRKKAKARIVLLGFEHPDLLSASHQTSSPVQALLTRNLSYQLVMERGWDIEGIDMSTAFLQTLPTEEEKKLWTTGVKELREALQIPEGGVMRILKNFYGSTTAPRNLWENVNSAMKKLGAHNIKGDACFWLWLVPDEEHPEVKHKPLGFMAGHVDDFHRAGDMSDERWLQVRKSIDEMYKWGSVKVNAYRHAGTDLEMKTDPKFGRCLVVDQSFYIETLQDIEIDPQRFSQGEEVLTAKEITACRASLGALQWLAVQTQPLICARCNLLLTELSTAPKMTIAQEIQEMIRELRKQSSTLKFFKLPKVTHWTKVHVIGLGDQAHSNRPRGGSTGGMLVFLGGPDAVKGEPTPLILVAWKAWKLKRVSIGTNDAEMQALVETEDAVYRTRLLWAEIHGAGLLYEGRNLLQIADQEVRMVPGVLGTDSKGGFDSVTVNESPLLGLSNMRAAIQAFHVKQTIRICGTLLIWLAGDWNLGDSLTKKKPESRESMLFYLRHRTWMLKYDPEFIMSARKIKQTQGTPVQQLVQSVMNSESFWSDAIDVMSDRSYSEFMSYVLLSGPTSGAPFA